MAASIQDTLSGHGVIRTLYQDMAAIIQDTISGFLIRVHYCHLFVVQDLVS